MKIFPFLAIVGILACFAIARADSPLPAQTPPTPPQSLLILSPHPDNETLGCGGLIELAVHNGCPVHVVFLTNGDGDRSAAARWFNVALIDHGDMRDYGIARQQESRNALAFLGVPEDSIKFLGYPDTGLTPMLDGAYTASHPYRSKYTGADHVPYADAVTPGAPYCAAAVLQDIERKIMADQPTDIYVTLPLDEHPDHAAAAIYAQQALRQLSAQDPAWSRVRLHYFLIHHRGWPVKGPAGDRAPLTPPDDPAFSALHWVQLPLSESVVADKRHALSLYRTQQQAMGGLLSKFVRANELFTQDAGE